jgi:hypothetical protein
MNMAHRLTDGIKTQTEALELFDSLEPVDVAFMLGTWKGEGCHTGHRMDGLLEAFFWYGKRFESAEAVHPLLFSTLTGGIAYVNPIFMKPALKVPVPKSPLVGRFMQLIMPLIATKSPRAKLQTVNFRGKEGSAMVYDQLPITDVFRKLDDNTVFAIMDIQGDPQPFFFMLHREVL